MGFVVYTAVKLLEMFERDRALLGGTAPDP